MGWAVWLSRSLVTVGLHRDRQRSDTYYGEMSVQASTMILRGETQSHLDLLKHAFKIQSVAA